MRVLKSLSFLEYFLKDCLKGCQNYNRRFSKIFSQGLSKPLPWSFYEELSEP